MTSVDRRRAMLGMLAPFVATATGRGHASRELAHEIVARRAREIGGTEQPLRLLVPQGCEDNLKPLRRRFTELSGIDTTLDVTAVDDVGGSILRRGFAGRDTFDVALPATFDIPTLVRGKLLRPLDEFAKRHEPSEAGDSLYRLGDRHGGSLYGYQTDGDAYLMFYDRRRLEDPQEKRRFADTYGRPLAPARTWAELDQLLAFFHRPEEKSYGGMLFRNAQYLAWEWWMRVHGAGAYPVGDDMVPRLDGPAGLAATEGLVRASRHLAPGVRGHGLFQNWRAFARGESLCNLGWGGTQKFLRSQAPEISRHILVTPPPGGRDWSAGYFNWGWNFCVGTRCRRPELAYLFALFAVCPLPSTESVGESGGFFDPYRDEHYRSDAVRSAYGEHFLEVHRRALRSCIPDFYVSGQRRYFQALTRNLVDADRGRCSPAEAMKRARRAWDHITRVLGTENQAKQWRDLKARYPRAVARHLK